MFQKGPGEGYMSAKEQVLAMAPDLKCRTVRWHDKDSVAGYVVERNGAKRSVGAGLSARAAWNDALDKLRSSRA